MRSTRIKMGSKEFYDEQRKWYAKLGKEGFHDIEGGKDLTCTRLMTNPGGDSTMLSLNVVQAQAGRPMVVNPSARGSEWEELISEQDFGDGKARYMHFAQLIVSQEYELCRLGTDRRASCIRLAWALHAQGLSERNIARVCEVSRHEIRKYIARLDEIIFSAIDSEE